MIAPVRVKVTRTRVAPGPWFNEDKLVKAAEKAMTKDQLKKVLHHQNVVSA